MNKTKRIYDVLVKNGKTLVDVRDLNSVLSKMLKEGAEFKVENTTAEGIFTVTMTRIPVNMFSYNPV